MGSLFKILLFTSPLLGLLFYYVVTQQAKIDATQTKDDAAFERSWNDFESEMAKSSADKQKFADRAREAEERLKKFEQQEKEKEQKAEKFEQEFEKAIENFEQEQNKNGGKK